ncbi:LysR family transcriptional regulator [Mycobacteroides franklinii]|uniref:HTH-type transcriptional regulator GltC n=1 Tax=Mycobacteroides franklinii TaxID=948102 RepID=A0A4R8QZ78_9MYCO|nr:LysR family transcriptional regulator [Mycobacteroides franklinii]TDZ45373.1 HTH-type transcriptional regulator GltC [Mycobacteroides franklinii]TDZ48864.1 HTH-type transcriptional regulator GltC [Mycobacteroides franklinii]TDZ59045.1 HTH-type transcriptional regulator GltC [Mycobacteroides franklinii]TDZ66559.1 HTH-type transcriptional regulator GltC [Mycobacteroides franklinii]TDZ72482.1 HTH-type transcriptional regulator GltC [Mycobacteroides franklinii]
MDRWTSQLAPQLRALVELAAHDGHMTQAALALDIPQSSMSRRIHALQEALGVPLLIHDGRTVRLTPEAHRLAARAREPLAELDHTLAELTGDADPEHGTVRFGFPLTMGSGHIPDLLAAFRYRHSGIRVLLKQAHGTELGAQLLSGHLDLAVVIPAPERLHHNVIGTQHIHIALPADHRLAGAAQLRLDELSGETFIANPPSYNLRQLTEKWCREAGYIPNIAIEVTEFSTIRELISRGLGIALLPHDDRTPPGIREIPLAGGGYHRSIALAWGTATRAAPTRCLNDFLLQHFSPAAVNSVVARDA